jgi:hypothetical protein
MDNQIDEINNIIESLTIDIIMLEKRINLLNKKTIKIMNIMTIIIDHLNIEKISKMMLE